MYRKKPIPVRAVRWFGPEDDAACRPAMITPSGDPSFTGYEIETLEGWLRLTPGCWIVGPGHKGEYWPVQADIFEATYEEIKEEK